MKKRIALVINTLSGGGAEKTVSNLSRRLYGQYDIDIIVNDTQHLDYPYRGHIVSLKMPSGQGALYQLHIVAKRIRVMRYLKKKRNYAAVISFSDMCNISNVFSGRGSGKTILSVRNSMRGEHDTSRTHKLLAPLVMPWCYRIADLTVSCSKGIDRELKERYRFTPGRNKVIYNGLELDTIRKKAKEPLNASEKEKLTDKMMILCVGRLSRQKGHSHLLKAVKKLKEEGFPVQLIILGEGDLRPSLEKLAVQLGIEDDVSLPGFCKNPYKYMACADVVVMPSLYEGFSNVILEALACGAPVISTDHETGAREILAPDTDYRWKVKDRIEEAAYGIIIPVCEDVTGEDMRSYTPQEVLMADAIRRILTDSNLAAHYRKAALQRAEQMDIHSVCEKWIQVIER